MQSWWALWLIRRGAPFWSSTGTRRKFPSPVHTSSSKYIIPGIGTIDIETP